MATFHMRPVFVLQHNAHAGRNAPQRGGGVVVVEFWIGFLGGLVGGFLIGLGWAYSAPEPTPDEGGGDRDERGLRGCLSQVRHEAPCKQADGAMANARVGLVVAGV